MRSPCPRLYHSGCHDKHNRPRFDSNLGPLTPQSDVLTTRSLMWEYYILLKHSVQLYIWTRDIVVNSLLRRVDRPQDHSTDAGRSPSSGAGSYRAISAAATAWVRAPAACRCRCRLTGQTDERTDTRPLHRRLPHCMRPASTM